MIFGRVEGVARAVRRSGRERASFEYLQVLPRPALVIGTLDISTVRRVVSTARAFSYNRNSSGDTKHYVYSRLSVQPGLDD